MKNPETVRAAGVVRNSCKNLNLTHRRGIIKTDARVLHFLKGECQRSGAGMEALQAVFVGLMSVHNKHLLELADALNRTGNE